MGLDMYLSREVNLNIPRRLSHNEVDRLSDKETLKQDNQNINKTNKQGDSKSNGVSSEKGGEKKFGKQDIDSYNLFMDISEKFAEKQGYDLSNKHTIHQDCGYWRKFNALHRYIDDNFNPNEMDDTRVYLGIDDIKQIRDTLKEVAKKIKMVDGYVEVGSSMMMSNTIVHLMDGTEKKIGELKIDDEIQSKDFENFENTKATIKRIIDDFVEVKFEVEDKVVENVDFCKEVFPTQCGFFFGSTDYDNYYYEDIKKAIKDFDKIIEDHNELVNSGIKEYDIDYLYLASY